MKEYGSKELIGIVKEVYKNIFRPDRRWDVWRGFYNGWIEGRSNILSEIRKYNLIGYEFHNYKTGHCYIDYEERQNMGEKDGYSKIPIYKV